MSAKVYLRKTVLLFLTSLVSILLAYFLLHAAAGGNLPFLLPGFAFAGLFTITGIWTLSLLLAQKKILSLVDGPYSISDIRCRGDIYADILYDGKHALTLSWDVADTGTVQLEKRIESPLTFYSQKYRLDGEMGRFPDVKIPGCMKDIHTEWWRDSSHLICKLSYKEVKAEGVNIIENFLRIAETIDEVSGNLKNWDAANRRHVANGEKFEEKSLCIACGEIITSETAETICSATGGQHDIRQLLLYADAPPGIRAKVGFTFVTLFLLTGILFTSFIPHSLFTLLLLVVLQTIFYIPLVLNIYKYYGRKNAEEHLMAKRDFIIKYGDSKLLKSTG